jgi:thiol-disulfide isomerase/thioredoxin
MDLSGRERDKLFLSHAGESFADCSYLSGADGVEDARAFAHADLDRDGHEDLIVVNRNAPLLKIYRNAARGGRFVGVLAEGSAAPDARGRASNRDAVGARLVASCGKLRLTREVERGAGFATTNSPSLTINLPAGCERLDQLTVRFPAGEERTFKDVATNRFYRAVEGKGLKEVPAIYDSRKPAAPAEATAAPLAAAIGRVAGSSAPLVVVSYWASWCAACARELPRVDALAAQLGGRAEVVGVSLEPKDDAGAVSAWTSAHAPRHRLFAYDEAIARSTEALFGRAPALPSFVVVDPRAGRVLARAAGTPSRSTIEQLLFTR